MQQVIVWIGKFFQFRDFGQASLRVFKHIGGNNFSLKISNLHFVFAHQRIVTLVR